MYGTITVNDKEMGFKASALTPVLFHQVFKFDLLVNLTKFEGKDEDNITNEESIEYLNLATRLGFIMNMQAEKSSFKQLGKINIDDYYEWLDKFDNTIDIPIPDIMSIYYGGELVDVEAKKEDAEPSEN